MPKPNDLTRRDFVKTTTLAIGAAGLPTASALAMQGAPAPAALDELRVLAIGVEGIGAWDRSQVNSHPKARIVGLCDIDTQRIESAKEDHPDAFTDTDYRRIFADRADEFDQVFDRINSTGFGLTMGIHSRIDSHVRKAIVKSHAGNIYVNRNIIGAVVGVQPFGGAGLSGTGPKAGGPSYLSRLLHTEALGEQDVSYSANGANEAFEGEWLELALEKRWELIHDVLGASLANYEWARVELGECTVLPGPTGEANFLELRSRGSVWIDPNVMDAQAESLLALALLAGNEVGIAVTATYAAKWRPLVEAGAISLRALSSEADHLALLASGEYTTLVMAPNEQMIAATAQVTQALPIVVDSGDEHLALQRFCHEVTVSENTTAAGGNAALMADID